MNVKRCIKCSRVLELDRFPFHNEGNGRRTYRNVCKDCYNAAKRLRNSKVPSDPKRFEPSIKDLVTSYLNLIRWDIDRLYSVPVDKFNTHFNTQLSIDQFTAIEKQADERLDSMGYYNPATKELDANGKYLIVGDSYGTHTPHEVFQLLAHAAKRYAVDGVIFIGRNVDDENLVSKSIANFKCPVYVLPIKDELPYLHAQRGYGYELVQDSIQIGDVKIQNQEHITPYVKSSISSLDPLLYPGKVIVNCTRHEYGVRPTPIRELGVNFIAAPGALATAHVSSTINRLIMATGERVMVRPTNKDSYHKHRKNEVDKMLWERGFIILDNRCPSMYRIFNKNGVYYTVAPVGNSKQIITHDNKPVKTKKALVFSDLHLPTALPFVETAIKSIDAVQIVFNGDISDCRAFNPHNASEAAKADLADELDAIDSFFKKALKDYKGETLFLYGNHEDFMSRFCEKYPQFSKLFVRLFTELYECYGRVMSCDDTDWKLLSPYTIIHHGSADIYGVGGNNLEKTARTFGKQAIIGHTHSAAIRFGVYRTGCCCRLDQGYNNAAMSNWNHGYAVVYSCNECDFVELVDASYKGCTVGLSL